MKTVFDNAMTCHVWAQQSQPYGRNSNGSLFFEGRTIYSYGHHFPMAQFHENGAVYLNPESYSVTTSAHQSLVCGAVRQYNRFRLPPKCWIDSDMELIEVTTAHDAAREHYTDLVSHHMERAARARSRRYMSVDAAREVCEESARYAQTFGLKPIWAVTMPATDDAALDEQRKADAKARREAAKTAREAKQAQFSAWMGGQSVMFPREYQPADGSALLRISPDGESVQTSQGATFPLDHAKRVGPAVLRLIRDAQRLGSASFDLSANPIRLGHFHIDRMDDQGNIYAGCHRVNAETVETFLTEKLGIPSAFAAA